MEDANEKPITGIRRDIGIYATLGYSRDMIKIFRAVRSAKICETKVGTGDTSLQGYTIREQGTASHFVFK